MNSNKKNQCNGLVVETLKHGENDKKKNNQIYLNLACLSITYFDCF